MAKLIKDIRLTWEWDGDIEDLKGFNVALCHSAQTPLTSTAAFATIINPAQRAYIFKNMIVSVGLEYDAYVQAIYEDKDSDWTSTGAILTVQDDGLSTVAQRRDTDTVQSIANSKVKTYFQSTAPAILDDSFGDIWIDTANNNIPKRCTDSILGQASFSRNSVAYIESNPFSYSSNAPRYKTGKFGSAIIIEEGTTNLLSSNASHPATNTAGFTGTNCNISRITTTYKYSNASIMATATSSGPGMSISVSTSASSIAAGEVITGSAWVARNSSFGIKIALSWRNSSNAQIGYSESSFNTGSSWQRLTITDTAPANTSYVIMMIIPANEILQNQYILLDGLQVEKKTTATEWQIGGSPRANELLTLPTDNVVNVNGITIGGWFYNNPTRTSTITKYFTTTLEEIDCKYETGVGYVAKVGDKTITANVTYETGWIHIAITRAVDSVRLFINGLLKGSATFSSLTIPAGTLIYIGSNPNSTNYLNAAIEDFRVYKRALGDSEVFMLYKYNTSVSDTSTLARFNSNLDYTTLAWTSAEDPRVPLSRTDLDNISSDSVLSPVEKLTIRKEWDSIILEEAELLAKLSVAVFLGITTEKNDYVAAITDLGTYLNGSAWSNRGTIPLNINNSNLSVPWSPIVQATFRGKFNTYYQKKQALINKMAEVASTTSTWGGIDGVPERFLDSVPATGQGLISTAAGFGYYNAGLLTSYIGNDGKFKFWGDANNSIDWNITAPGALTIRGKLTAGDIQSGGTMSAVNISGGTISIGSGNNIFKADSNGIYLGNGTFASAPFRVTPAGALTATNATITGAITATSGSFAGSISSGNTITCGGITIGAGSGSNNGNIRLGKTIYSDSASGFWLGNDAGVAKFKLYKDSNNYLDWNGNTLDIKGTISAGSINLSAVTLTTPLTLTYTGECVSDGGNGITKNGGSSVWNSSAFSSESYTNGAYVSFMPYQNNIYVMVGLNTDASSDSGYTTLDYAWYCNENGYLLMYESNVPVTPSPTIPYTSTDVLSITYDGYTIRYFKNGGLVRSVHNVINKTFFFDSSFYTPGARIINVKFGPFNGISFGPNSTYIDSNGAYIGTINANNITTGSLRGINVNAGSHTTKGSFLTSASSADATTLYLNNTDDFPTSGSGWILDSGLVKIDSFSWTGKTGTTLTGCSGVLAHNLNATVIPNGKAFAIDTLCGEMTFFGDRGDGTNEFLASLGTNNYGADKVLLQIGSSTSSHYGIIAESNNNPTIYGIYHGSAGTNRSPGESAVVGVSRSAGVHGVWGTSYSGYGLRGESVTSYGVVGYTDAAGASDFYAASANANYTGFTGSHEVLFDKGSCCEVGDIIEDVSIYLHRGMSNCIGVTRVATEIKSPNVIGVLGSYFEFSDTLWPSLQELPEKERSSIKEIYDGGIVNSVGEGQINVCKDAGNIYAGDYICSSSRPGKGMKQDDDLLHNYTVAKAREDCIWTDEEDDIRMIACTYHCG